MSAFVSGLELAPKMQAEVLKVHAKPYPLMPLEWLAGHGFYLTAKGSLDKRHKQAWPITKGAAQ